MAIGLCEYCGKPFNCVGGMLCVPCSKIMDETYIKVRRYIYQNPKDCEFIAVIEATEVSEKALNYLIKKGRIEISGTTGGGLRCRACGKETTSGSVCEQCMSKIVSEKLMAKETKETKNTNQSSGGKKIIPMSYD